MKSYARSNLEPNTEVQITLDIPDTSTGARSSFLDVAEKLKLDGPPDWSQNVDKYLYGTVENTDG